ncbi:MAG: hypothetical protein R3362_11835 [Rhodothermales bacterium]|nr:hypothetical protein [Rhodothermales bacterium]
MKSLLLPLLAALAAFLAGLGGTYVLLPVVAPEVAEARRLQSDSLAVLAADSVAVADSALAGALPLPPDAPADSTDAADAPPAAPDPRVAELEARVDDLNAQLAARTEQAARAQELASTLTKLEDGELEAILAELDTEILTLLYEAGSAREQARLLKALKPQRAARFVQHLAASELASATSAPPPQRR